MELYCPECDIFFEIETDLESQSCRKCRSLCMVVPPGGNWTSMDSPPTDKVLCKVRMSDGTEAFAVWSPDLKGFMVDLPDDYDPKGDKVKMPEGPVKEWRLTYE